MRQGIGLFIQGVCEDCSLLWPGGCQSPIAVGKKSIRLYEGNPINLQYPLLQCFGRTQGRDC